MTLSKNQLRKALLTLVLGTLFAFYAALKMTHLHDSAALYVGLPFLLALLVSLIETERPSRTAMQVLTIAILLSPIIIGEGFICMIMAAPILYIVTYIASATLHLLRKSLQEGDKSIKAASVLILIFALSAEGVTPLTSATRYNEVTVEKIIDKPAQDIRAAFAKTPSFDKRPDSFYTRLFPAPVTVTGSGLEVGDQRRIHLVYNKWVVMNPLSGDAVFEVAEASDNHVRFRNIKDTSYINLYLLWDDATATWEPAGAGRTKISVTLRYYRKLDPFWYFGPMERSAVRDTAETIIDSL